MNLKFTFILLLITPFLTAQTIIDFEEFAVEKDSFLNGSDGNGGFESRSVFLPNNYNPEFESWTGWAISSKTDTLTPGFSNQYSAIAGSGYAGSANYAVSYFFDNNQIKLSGAASGRTVDGFYITNNTYAYLSMRDGDGFSKKFGGATGNDPDFFSVTIKAFSNGELSTDSIDFYLADYRFADNSQDYIVKDWTWVDLSGLGAADSLLFTMASSDVGQFGINTPTYFCLDQLTISEQSVSNQEVMQEELIEIYPNPASDFLYIVSEEHRPARCHVYNSQGQLVLQKELSSTISELFTGHLPEGVYWVTISNRNQKVSKKIVIE